MDVTNLPSEEFPGDIESSPVGDVTTDSPLSPGVDSTEFKDLETVADRIEGEDKELIDHELTIAETKTVDTKLQDKALDAIIFQALTKMKEHFFHNEIEEQKIAEFLFKILTLNVKDMDIQEFKVSPEVFDQLITQMVDSRDANKPESDVSDLYNSLFGAGAAKAISEKLCTEKIDDVVTRLLGEDTRKMICEKLGSENLDDLLNLLIDEKLQLDEDPEAKHPNFDDFVNKILGKETEEYIRKKLEAYLDENSTENETTALDVKDND